MTEVFDETKAVCANCGADGAVSAINRTTGRPDGWGTSLITTNSGIVTNSILCDQCLLVVRYALADRRQENDKTVVSAPEEVQHTDPVPNTDEAAWVSENVPPAKPQQSSRSSRRGNNKTGVVKGDIEANSVDSAPVQVDAVTEIPGRSPELSATQTEEEKAYNEAGQKAMDE